jgi:hypothetical protein
MEIGAINSIPPEFRFAQLYSCNQTEEDCTFNFENSFEPEIKEKQAKKRTAKKTN